MKITKSQLKQIIKEELEKVLNEEVDLDNLAGEIVRRNEISGKGGATWLDRSVWYRDENARKPERSGKPAVVYTDVAGAYKAMLESALNHWSFGKWREGLEDPEKAALEGASAEFDALKLAIEEMPGSPIAILDEFVPQNRTPTATKMSQVGREIWRQQVPGEEAPPARTAPPQRGGPDDDL